MLGPVGRGFGWEEHGRGGQKDAKEEDEPCSFDPISKALEVERLIH